MTRPRKATVDYFPHACNHGKTMFILEERWGNDGYAFWFKLLEILGSSEGHVYDAGNPAAWRYLTAKTRSDDVSAADILQCLSDLEAIDPVLWSEKVIWCQNFVDGIKDVYRKRAEDIPIRPDIRRRKSQTNGISGVENPQSKLKESKVNKTRDNAPQPPEGESIKKSHSKIKKQETFIPDNFQISPEVIAWAKAKGFGQLNDHLEAFIDLCKANGYKAVDWDSKFKNAIRNDWGKIRQGNNGSEKKFQSCVNHPDIRASGEISGRSYCRECLDDYFKPPPTDDFIKQIAGKMGI